ncbi:hypothetical protein F8M41_006835 [Gigaspora margarita]|uniref:Uncharacterized protein n=1 Tax=Gigaspora margarita TaxID=4874 RepID=A0A8H3X8G0_GIGMA|nr:hypothetical protein F8M41_006835 [Gigaspora margarita]
MIRSQFQETKDYNSSEINPSIAILDHVPLICAANISLIHPIQKGRFALALINKEVCLIQILAIYYRTSTRNNHSYTEEPISNVNLITFVSTKVFKNL